VFERLRRDSLALPRRNGQPEGCDCTRCSHCAANLRIHRALHPFAARRLRLPDVPLA